MSGKSFKQSSRKRPTSLEQRLKDRENSYLDKYLPRDLQRFQESIAKWQRDGQRLARQLDDPEQAKLTVHDVRQMQKVYQAVESGNYQKAFTLAWELDTAVREQIPMRLYNYLAKTAGYQ